MTESSDFGSLHTSLLERLPERKNPFFEELGPINNLIPHFEYQYRRYEVPVLYALDIVPAGEARFFVVEEKFRARVHISTETFAVEFSDGVPSFYKLGQERDIGYLHSQCLVTKDVKNCVVYSARLPIKDPYTNREYRIIGLNHTNSSSDPLIFDEHEKYVKGDHLKDKICGFVDRESAADSFQTAKKLNQLNKNYYLQRTSSLGKSGKNNISTPMKNDTYESMKISHRKVEEVSLLSFLYIMRNIEKEFRKLLDIRGEEIKKHSIFVGSREIREVEREPIQFCCFQNTPDPEPVQLSRREIIRSIFQRYDIFCSMYTSNKEHEIEHKEEEKGIKNGEDADGNPVSVRGGRKYVLYNPISSDVFLSAGSMKIVQFSIPCRQIESADWVLRHGFVFPQMNAMLRSSNSHLGETVEEVIRKRRSIKQVSESVASGLRKELRESEKRIARVRKLMEGKLKFLDQIEPMNDKLLLLNEIVRSEMRDKIENLEKQVFGGKTGEKKLDGVKAGSSFRFYWGFFLGFLVGLLLLAYYALF